MKNEQNTETKRFQMALTAAIMLFAFFLARSGKNESQQWAFGVIGTLMGYWLKAI